MEHAGRASQQQAGLDGTRVVSVPDREGDLFELLHAGQRPEAADILMLAQHSRQLADGGGRLIEHLDAEPWSAELELHIPHRGNQAVRTARMAVHFDRMTLAPPRSKRGFGEVTLDAVRCTEIEPPAGVKPLSLTLVTSVLTETACQRLQWYATRWQIEVNHRTFKSGYRLEDRQLGSADRLETCLAIDLVIAWRVFWLTKQAREAPREPGRHLLRA